MEIRKFKDRLLVSSRLDFGDENCLFCVMPYAFLSASKERTEFYDANTICISVRDYDDYDYGLIYITDNEHFFNVLHELINWMRDHEQGINNHYDLIDIFNFFPDLGCERRII